MKKIYPFAFVLLISCSPKLVYVGNSYSPSRQVDVYIDDAAIKKPYEVIGIVTPDLNGTWIAKNYDGVVAKKAIETARKKGADGILFHNYYLKPEGPETKRESTTVYTDTSVHSNTTVSSTASVRSTGRQILLLKYRP